MSFPDEPRTRPARRAVDPPTDADVIAATEPLRRFVEARATADDDVDDVVQETLTRLWAVRWRLERTALFGYGVVVARNLLVSRRRADTLDTRNRHRLVPGDAPPDPVELSLAAEERTALAAGLAALPAADRRLLVGHEVADLDTAKLAAEASVSRGAIAARLARARARLRVEHLLALRRVELPTTRCRPVLFALSLGDARRQRTVGAGRHLLACPACAELAEPLLARRRTLTAAAPVLLLLLLLRRLVRWTRAHPVPATAGAVAVAGVTAVAIVATGSDPAPPPPAPTAAASPATAAVLTIGGATVLPADRVGSLRRNIGGTAMATRAPVQSVPADEGFWIGTRPGARVWVQLRTRGESPVTIRAGQRVTFRASVQAVDAGTPDRVGLSVAEGAAELRATGVYLSVDQSSVRIG